MEKLYTKIMGTPVIDDDIRHPVAQVKDLVIDPEDGKLLAVVVDLHKNLVIAPMDILNWGMNMRIHNRSDIIEGSEILRVDAVQRKEIKVFQNKVMSKDGDYLGMVNDFSIDSKSLVLKKLFVAKGFMGLVRYQSRIINKKDIIEILADKIVVKNNLGEVPQEAEGVVASDLAVS